MKEEIITVQEMLEAKKWEVVINRGKRAIKNTLTKENIELIQAVDLILKDFPTFDRAEVNRELNAIEIAPASGGNIVRSLEIANDIKELKITQKVDSLITWSIDGVTASLEEVANAIWVLRDKKNRVTINKYDITTILSEMDNEVTRKAFSDFKIKIKHVPNLPDKFEALARLVSGENYDPHYPNVLKHVIWTIKRRVYGLQDYCPIFLSIYGSAGKGKSEFLKAMFSLLPPNRLDISSYAKGMFEDPREKFRFVQYFVCIMDELSGLSKTEINYIKNTIDQTKHVYRILGSNRTAEGRNNAQLLGTSNTRLRNIITADRDIRKWAEIDIAEFPDEEVPSKLVEPAKAFDWLTLWQSVNEDGPAPFADSKVYSDFKEWTAKKCQHESAHSLFIEGIIDTHGGEWISKREIFDEGYKLEVKDFPLNWANFKEKCEKVGFKAHKRDTGIGLLVPKNEIETMKDKLFSVEDN